MVDSKCLSMLGHFVLRHILFFIWFFMCYFPFQFVGLQGCKTAITSSEVIILIISLFFFCTLKMLNIFVLAVREISIWGYRHFLKVSIELTAFSVAYYGLLIIIVDQVSVLLL